MTAGGLCGRGSYIGVLFALCGCVWYGVAGVAPGLAVCIVWRCVLGGLYRGSYVSTAISELSSYCSVLFITSLMCVIELLFGGVCGMPLCGVCR